MTAQKLRSPWRKLKKGEIEQFRIILREGMKDGDTLTARHVSRALDVSTQIDLPLGELLNPHLAGWIWGWQLSGKIGKTGAIPPGHQFSAQGIEGMVTIVRISFIHALLVSDDTGLNRIEIFVPRIWTYRGPRLGNSR
jgi:hypothetical protein